MGRRLLVLSALFALLAGFAPLGASAGTHDEGAHPLEDSLPSVGTGERPGPDVLYAQRPPAPQLENRDPRFRAAPLLVSGTEAYVDGEYLYQDYLHDDFGANTDGNDGIALAPSAGNLTYPTDRERYAGNAADLVEFRVAPGADEVAYRITLGVLPEPDATMVAIVLDTDGDASTGATTLPRDPGADFPGTDEVIFAWGTGGEHVAFDDAGEVTGTTGVEVVADTEAAQITVTVPRAVSDPQGTVLTTVATGLYDPEDGGWLLPALSADESTPGGAGPLAPDPPGIFNLAFRFDEPIESDGLPPDSLQADALTSGEPTRFAHDLDFAAMEAGETRSTVPTTGTMVRLFPSRVVVDDGGRDLDTFPALRGQLQPYSVYVPTGEGHDDPPGLTLDLHSLSSHHWQYNGSTGVQQLGEQRNHVVATPQARGDDGWYTGLAEYDVFEVWNDLAHHYRLDPDRTSSAGYSMGGYGTYRLVARYPDLFGTAMTLVGPPTNGIWVPGASGEGHGLSNRFLASVRNVPFLNVAAAQDELVPIAGPTAHNTGVGALADGVLGDVLDQGGVSEIDAQAGFTSFEELGYRYHYRVYPTAEHFTLALLSYEVPGSVEFLGDGTVDRAPHHVTYTAVPATDDAELGLVGDGAYWVAGLVLADDAAGDVPKGVVDAFSHGHGLARPDTERHTDGGVGPLALAYTEVGLDWTEPAPIDPANLLEVTLTNVGVATIDLARAALDPEEELTLEIVSDADGELHLDGAFPDDTEVRRDTEVLAGASAGPDGALVPVIAGEQTVVLAAAPPPQAPDAPPADPPADTPAADPPAADDQRPPLPATGGGTGLLAVTLLGAALLLRRRGGGLQDRAGRPMGRSGAAGARRRASGAAIWTLRHPKG